MEPLPEMGGLVGPCAERARNPTGDGAEASFWLWRRDARAGDVAGASRTPLKRPSPFRESGLLGLCHFRRIAIIGPVGSGAYASSSAGPCCPTPPPADREVARTGVFEDWPLGCLYSDFLTIEWPLRE